MRGIHLPRRGADRWLVARGTTLRRVRPFRFRRSRSQLSTERLETRIRELVAERQELRSRGARASALERNRIRIARAQWELGHALIEQNLPDPDDVETAPA